MNLKENKKLIQDIYDKGLFQGVSYNTKKNVIQVAVKDKNHYKIQELKTEYPLRDYESLKEFCSKLSPTKEKEIVSEETNVIEEK